MISLSKKINLTKCTKRKFYTKDFYTIILISKGNCDFELQHGVTSCNTETALLLKPDTSIQMEYRNDKKALELFAIHIHPSLLVKLSDESCDLVHGFSFIPLDKAMIHLDTRDTTLIKNITKTTMTLLEETTEFGHELYLKNMVSILLVLFLRSCIASDHVKLSHRKKELVMDDVFRYIRTNLTGQTIHSYIVKSRLDLCKKYIEAVKPIKEVYALGGFGSYNHFFRAFKNEYGMTPKQYYESLTE